jgi:LEA14-like dessication related protein
MTMMTKRIRHAAVLLAAALLPACTAGLERPEVELEGLQIGSLGLTGGTLLANVRVENPNRFTLRGGDLRYQLFLKKPNSSATSSAAAGDSAWVRIAEGTYEEDLEIRGHESRTFQVPIEFSFADLGSAASSIMRTGRVDYRATGTVDVRTPFGSREVPFRKTGTFMMAGTR